jgi:hypothetical protein
MTNQRWYTSEGTIAFVQPDDVHHGEVRVNIVEQEGAKAYIMCTSPHPANELGPFISNQLNGSLDNERYAEDFTWVQEMIDELLVPDERCKVAWGACRGSMKGTEDPRFLDVIGLIIAADLYSDPNNPESHFRIATYPIGPWDDRLIAVEQGLRSMALQRFAREQLVTAAVANRAERGLSQEGERALPLPGLRLTRNIEPEIDPDGDGVTRFLGPSWDLTSVEGGLAEEITL